MLSSDEAYRPDEDLDPNSKSSLLQWISHLLGLSRCLNYDKNGNLPAEELVILTKSVLKKTQGVEDNPEILSEAIESIQNELDPDVNHDTISSLEALKIKTIDKLKKQEHGLLIAASLSFQFLGDAHIGKSNGVLSLIFLREIHDSLDHTNVDDFSKRAYPVKRRLGRDTVPMNARALYEMFKHGESENEDDYKEGTTVPEFQRSDQQWKRKQWLNFIDSALRNIPMPSIVLGKSKDQMGDPWQVIDGNQRLSTIVKIYDQKHKDHIRVTKPWRKNNQMPQWIYDRLEDYTFNVEKVIAGNERELAELYERYNDSGVKMTSAQIRVAKFHETSALHHLLLALSGGPVLRNRPNARKRLGIDDSIEIQSKNAQGLRRLLPGNFGVIHEDEKLQLRKTTEKVYDLYCSIIAYATYRGIRKDFDFPSAKHAIEYVFNHYRKVDHNDGNNAETILNKLNYVVKEVSTLYGDFAFLTLRSVPITGEYDEGGQEKIEHVIGKSFQRWASQVQCAALWELSEEDIALIKKNPDDFQMRWKDFCINNMVNKPQNSKSIWNAQKIWRDEVHRFLSSLRSVMLNDQNSPVYKRLLAEVQRAVDMPEEGQESFISGWTEELFTKDEITFLRKTYKRMKKD